MSVADGRDELCSRLYRYPMTDQRKSRAIELAVKRLRFAPSPNGYLHLGHIYSMHLNREFADLMGAECLLRVEDIDLARSKAEYVTAVFEDLAWMGFSWPEPVLRQSSRFDAYRAALHHLQVQELVYPAFLSRKQIKQVVSEYERKGQDWPKDPDGSMLYPGQCKQLSMVERQQRIDQGEAYNWRLDMDKALRLVGEKISWREIDSQFRLDQIAASPEQWGDVVLARRDVPTSYHLSVVVDDAFQDIDCVVRGRDLFHATSVHRLLQILLDLPQPIYHHHELLKGEDLRKLSKSEGAMSIRHMRDQKHLSADDILALMPHR